MRSTSAARHGFGTAALVRIRRVILRRALAAAESAIPGLVQPASMGTKPPDHNT